MAKKLTAAESAIQSQERFFKTHQEEARREKIMFQQLLDFQTSMMPLVNLNSAMSGRPQGPYTVKKRNPVVGILNK